MAFKFRIVVIYDFDENEYVCFCSELGCIEGRGETEDEAKTNFLNELERRKNES